MTYFIFKRIVAVTNTSNVRIIVYHFRVRGLFFFIITHILTNLYSHVNRLGGLITGQSADLVTIRQTATRKTDVITTYKLDTFS